MFRPVERTVITVLTNKGVTVDQKLYLFRPTDTIYWLIFCDKMCVNMKRQTIKGGNNNNKEFFSLSAPTLPENIHFLCGFFFIMLSLWSLMVALSQWRMFFGGHEGLCTRKQVKKWWHCMDTPFQTDSHWNLWLWFLPQMAEMKRTVIHISRPKDPQRDLGIKRYEPLNYTKVHHQHFISDVLCSPCRDVDMEGKERGTSIPLQTGSLSAVCMSHDPHLAHARVSNPHPTCRPQRKSLSGIVHLWASLKMNWRLTNNRQYQLH